RKPQPDPALIGGKRNLVLLVMRLKPLAHPRQQFGAVPVNHNRTVQIKDNEFVVGHHASLSSRSQTLHTTGTQRSAPLARLSFLSGRLKLAAFSLSPRRGSACRVCAYLFLACFSG